MEFDKSIATFSFKGKYIFLSNCGIAPLYKFAKGAVNNFNEWHTLYDPRFLPLYGKTLERFHRYSGKLLQTKPNNISFVKNTSEGISMIANGYPFRKGDEIISYIHEYPANHYPWKLQKSRGVKLTLLNDLNPTGKPTGWSFNELEKTVSKKTKVIAISHVQFTSGFKADLEELGAFCKYKEIDLIVDAAQSIGCLPIYPEKWNISAVASSGWKWLMGPIGTGLLYTSPELREKLSITMTGADMMKQGQDYLNHAWKPLTDGGMFEYSTHPIALLAGLVKCINGVSLKYGIENIFKENLRLQDIFLENLNKDLVTPVSLPKQNRSGIIALNCPKNPERIKDELFKRNVICSVRGGYLRVAPHFYNSEMEMEKASWIVNKSVRT